MFDVFKKIKGTPKYWGAAKTELVAKVKQLGPFHIFYTFSCGEMRWTEVFLSIFRREGLDVHLPPDWNGNEAELLVEGFPLWDYVNSKMSKNQHKLFKDYIFLITRLFDARVKSFVTNILMGPGKDKIPFKYYSYRVEFQARGMPHIHGVAWIDRDWLLKVGITGDFSDEKHEKAILEKIVDKLITCQLPEENPKLNNIVKEVQKHKHTKSCLKYNGACRYNFPKLPCPVTILAKPETEADGTEEQRRKNLNDAKIVLEKAKTLLNTEDLDENMSFETFCEKIGTTRELYLKYIGLTSKGRVLILKRTIKERNINNYSVEMLECWNANMDIQLALEPYAVITYIVSYVLKDEQGITLFLKATLQESACKNVKERLKDLKETYLTHRQIGASEAVYRALPDMKLKDSNVATIYVSTGFPENRSVFYKKVDSTNGDEEQIDQDDNNDDEVTGNYNEVDSDTENDNLDDLDDLDDFQESINKVQIEGCEGHYYTSTPSPWLTLLLVLGKNRVNQISC